MKQAGVAQQLNGTVIMNLPLKISLATKVQESQDDYELPSNAKGLTHTIEESSSKPELKSTIFVTNINKQVTTTLLIDFFAICGPICYLRLSGDENPVKVALIEFLDESGAKIAISLSGTQVLDKPIKVYKSKHAIYKPPLKLTRSEDDALYDALKHVYKKIKEAYPEKFEKKDEKKDEKPREKERRDDRRDDRRDYYRNERHYDDGRGGDYRGDRRY
jgi:RNA recognition motif-containing protein